MGRGRGVRALVSLLLTGIAYWYYLQVSCMRATWSRVFCIFTKNIVGRTLYQLSVRNC